MADAENIHATVVAIGDRGVLVMGASGAGKTTLALTLLDRAARAGLLGRLVADDQARVAEAGGRVVARSPEAISGLVELRGLGPRPVSSMAATVLDLAVRLVPAADAQRLPDSESMPICGCPLPLLRLKERNAAAAARVVMAWLGHAPFLPHGEP